MLRTQYWSTWGFLDGLDTPKVRGDMPMPMPMSMPVVGGLGSFLWDKQLESGRAQVCLLEMRSPNGLHASSLDVLYS
jgi:hypothetical protein